MFINDYRPEDYSKQYFDVSDGNHDIKIVSATTRTSKTGKQMIEVSYVAKECMAYPYIENYVEGEYFNKNMTRFFDAFCIQPGNFNFQSWIGKKGVGCFEHRQETFTGKDGMQKTITKCHMAYLVVPERGQPQQAPQQYQQQPVQQVPPVQQNIPFTEDIPF